jgi:hypothetical protein
MIFFSLNNTREKKKLDFSKLSLYTIPTVWFLSIPFHNFLHVTVFQKDGSFFVYLSPFSSKLEQISLVGRGVFVAYRRVANLYKYRTIEAASSDLS